MTPARCTETKEINGKQVRCMRDTRRHPHTVHEWSRPIEGGGLMTIQWRSVEDA